jgi:hypothetical protein
MNLHPRIYEYLQSRSYCLHCNVCYGGGERLRNVTYLFLMVKMDPLNVVSHNVAASKNVSNDVKGDSY